MRRISRLLPSLHLSVTTFTSLLISDALGFCLLCDLELELHYLAARRPPIFRLLALSPTVCSLRQSLPEMSHPNSRTPPVMEVWLGDQLLEIHTQKDLEGALREVDKPVCISACISTYRLAVHR